MNNMIKIFKNEEFGSLRILKDDNGRIMFCGKDVASALGYSNTKDAIKRHCRWGVKHDLPHPQSPSKTIKMIFIPEGDVYRLVAHSKLPRAAEFESWIFDKILPQIEDWQNRPLDEVYPILYIDAIHYSVRDNGVIRKLAAYVILGINTEGKKEVLSITVGDNESSKYWLSVLNELKNRGVKDILITCADGLSGIKEAIAAAFPKTEYQRCIVHQVRNTLKYVPDKDRKAFASDLKTIYHASDEEKARLALDRVTEKWTAKYPNSMKRWYDNWDAITPIFKFSPDVRKVIYTTNAIESLNSTYRKLNRQRSVFPSDTALLKALYLATFEATKKWTMSIRNWGQVYGELSIMYEGRLPE